MIRAFREHLHKVHGGVGVATFLVTAALLHLLSPAARLLSTSAVLFFALGTVAAAGVTGAIGTGLQRGIATLLGRAEISPRTAAAAHYAMLIAVAILVVEALITVGLTWAAFRIVYH